METVAVGKLTDVVLQEVNSLDSIGNTKRIATVVLNGRYLSRTALDTLFDRAAAIVKRYCGSAACCGLMSATRQHHISR